MSYGPGNAGGAVTIIGLNYGGQGPFDVPVFGLPSGWAGSGNTTMGAQLTVGTNIGSGLLLDMNSDPIPDGFSFSAFIFVVGSTIFDIVAINPYSITAAGGILSWRSEGPTPTSPTQIQTLGGISISTSPTSSNGLSLTDNGPSGIGIQTQGTGGIGIQTEGGGASAGIGIATQASDTGGITITDNSGVGIGIFSTKVVIGNHGSAWGNDSVAIGDSAVAYSADQTVVASTNANSLGVGTTQHSVVVGTAQSVNAGTYFLNTCVGANVLQLLDAESGAMWNRTIHIHAVVVARRVDIPGTDSAWQAEGVLRGDGTGTYSWIGGDNPAFTVIAQDAGAADWSVGFQITGPFLEIPVEADDGMTVNWEVTLHLDEVGGDAG